MKKLAFGFMCTIVFAGTSFAQVSARKENQQDRIAQGVKSGQLTPGETVNLENRERALNGEVRADRAANGGTLTSAEKRRLSRQQNQISRSIYRDKHNSASDHFGSSEVGRREENQQDRIAQGIKSGKLSAGQTANLENRERGIQQEVRADRAANGGKLTPGEKRQIHRQQNRASRAIHRAKR